MEESVSRSKEKRRILLIRLNTLVFVVTTLYAILDKYLGIEVETFIYLGFYIFTIINALLIRYRYIEACKIFGLLVFNIMIFLVATSEPFSTGMYLHFVSAGAVALALYGYEQWKMALVFPIFSLLLAIVTFSTDVSFVPFREVEDPGQARVFFLLNIIIMAFVGIFTIMLYSKINYDSEQSLQKSETLIKEQNEMLIKANQELDRFVYSASHDLRAPISTLMGLMNILEIEENEDKKKEYLGYMKKRLKSMDTFISEITDYGRNMRVEVEIDKVDLNELLRDIVKDLRYSDYWAETDISWELRDDLFINSDQTRLNMIFTNLVSNALKYRDPKKDKSWIRIKGSRENGIARISIEDNGLGIESEKQGQIFDMFYQAHTNSSGSGLGLYLVKETLKKLSGSISLRSTEGEGSEFTVTLPVDLSAG